MNRRERQERFEGLKRLGCIACILEERGYMCGPVEVHHFNKFSLHGHERMGDEYTIGLGPWHHRGVQLPGMTRKDMAAKFGPSWAAEKNKFVLKYEGDSHLLEITNAKLDWLLPAIA